MAESQTMQDALLATFCASATHGTVFSADPGRTGTVVGEVALSRVALTWGAPVSVGAARTRTATALINVGAGSTVNWAGVCSASTGNTLLDSSVTTTFTLASPFSYTVTFVRSEP